MINQKQQLLDKGWEFHDVGGNYPNGIMVHPDLAKHWDWQCCIEHDQMQWIVSYDLDYIRNLFNSPVFAGDNDWSERIIKL